MSSRHPHGTEAARQYESAYQLHQSNGSLLEAFLAYDRLIQEHPHSQEAGYCRSQMTNIVKSAVPASELWASQYQLAIRFLKGEGKPVGVD